MVGFFACEDETEFEVTGEEYVALTQASASVPESGSVTSQDGVASVTNGFYTATVIRSTSDLSADLTVNFTLTGVYLSTSDFADPGDDAASTFASAATGSIVIPAGRSQASFGITAFNDLFSTGDRALTLTITGTSDSNFEIGYVAGGLGGVTAITVVDDDCPINIPGDWEGFYEVSVFTAAPGSNNDPFSPGAPVGWQTELVLDPSDPTNSSVLLKGGATINGVTALFVADVPLKFETCPGTVLIGSDAYTMNFSQNSAAAVLRRGDEPAVYGTGTFKEDGSEFTITCTYSNTDGLNFDEFNVTFKRVTP